MQVDGIETRGVEWGDQLVRHIDLPAGVDFTPLFKGLPGDLCQCPHWGIVLEGSIHLRYADGTEETTRPARPTTGPAATPAGPTRASRSSSSARPPRSSPVLEHLAAQMAASA